MRVRGVHGLPLLRVDHPVLGTVARFVKGATDRVGALLTLLLVAPVLPACVVAVRRDGGLALRRRTCVGRGGREFALLTFRTAVGDSGVPTRVGRLLRRLCLDELPQLLNVLGGSMALVGPRPSTPGEVAGDRTAGRRLLVKPGLTGLCSSTTAPVPPICATSRGGHRPATSASCSARCAPRGRPHPELIHPSAGAPS